MGSLCDFACGFCLFVCFPLPFFASINHVKWQLAFASGFCNFFAFFFSLFFGGVFLFIITIIIIYDAWLFKLDYPLEAAVHFTKMFWFSACLFYNSRGILELTFFLDVWRVDFLCLQVNACGFH